MRDALQYSRKDFRHALPTSAGKRERSAYIVYIGASSISTVHESISSLKGPRGSAWCGRDTPCGYLGAGRGGVDTVDVALSFIHRGRGARPPAPPPPLRDWP